MVDTVGMGGDFYYNDQASFCGSEPQSNFSLLNRLNIWREGGTDIAPYVRTYF